MPITPSFKTRVLMLLENNPYPQDDRVRREAETLAEAGYEVRLICPASQNQQSREVINGVTVYRYPAPPSGRGLTSYVVEYGYAMAASWMLSLAIFLRHGFDIIHAANPPDTFAFIGIFYKALGKRFVYDHHDLAPEMYLARFSGAGSKAVFHALVWFEWFACKVADRIIATNDSYKAVEMSRAGVAAQRIQVVRNGPDLDRMRKSEPSQGVAPTDRIILGYVGVTGFQDGLDYLLRAIRHLRFTLGRSDFICMIIGAGDALPSLQSLSRELDIADHVRFLGWVQPDEVAQHLSRADICIAPEPSNGYTDRSTTIKLMEYMALEKPVVAFDLPEHRVTAGNAALFVPANDELAFAKAIVKLMKDSSCRRSMGRLGRQRVENQLAWSHSVPELLKMYEELCKGMGCPRRNYMQKLNYWWRKRGFGYLLARLSSLGRRYSFNPEKAKCRVRDCVRFLNTRQCSPTFPTPGRVVERNPEFCREVQELGAELAVHGYDHVDFQSLSDAETHDQLVRAGAAFDAAGIHYHGLRCPYLSYSDRLNGLLPRGQFEYSSNKAILWSVIPQTRRSASTDFFEKLQTFYRPESAACTVSMPRVVDGVVELPVSLPDDLQLYDGLKLRGNDLAQPWVDILYQTHRMSQLFVLMFHPELFEECKPAFEKLLDETVAMAPPIWIARLQDIAHWWLEKEKFTVTFSEHDDRLELHFHCSERATILMRGLVTEGPTSKWDDVYQIFQSRYLVAAASPRPFLGIAPAVPDKVVSFLRQQGYLIDQTAMAPTCSIYLSEDALSELDNEIKLLQYIEGYSAPLVRYSPWPHGQKSALSITGDLDALSLTDYTARLFT